MTDEAKGCLVLLILLAFVVGFPIIVYLTTHETGEVVMEEGILMSSEGGTIILRNDQGKYHHFPCPQSVSLIPGLRVRIIFSTHTWGPSTFKKVEIVPPA